MANHPTFVHAAADLRRQALLREVAKDWSTTPAHVRRKRTGLGTACRRMVAQFAAVVSRVIDDFEPTPGARSQRSKRLERGRVAGPSLSVTKDGVRV
jgi:hypothetical protein